MWLEDDEIRRKLVSQSAADITAAIEALRLRLDGGETPDVFPVQPQVLHAYDGRIPVAVLSDFLGLLLKADRLYLVPLDKAAALEGTALIVTDYADAHGAHTAALALKTEHDPVQSVRAVVRHIGERLRDHTPAQFADPAFFLSCLLDGHEAVRAAVIGTLQHWPHTPRHTTILNELKPELTEHERQQLMRTG